MACVFLVSAYWHGFYFGYFAFFIGMLACIIAWKTFPRTKLCQAVTGSIPHPLDRIFSTIFTFVVTSYFGMSYVLYDLKPALQMWDSFYYSGHIIVIIAIVLGAILPKVKK